MSSDAHRDERATLPPAAEPRWTVRITYREPTYETSRSLPPREFRASFVVSAANESEAHRAGLAAFREAVSAESVGWVREVVQVECVRGE